MEAENRSERSDPILEALKRDLIDAKKAEKKGASRFQSIAPAFFESERGARLAYCEGDRAFYRYEGTHYRCMGEDEMLQSLFDFLAVDYAARFSVTDSKLRDFLKSLPFVAPRRVPAMDASLVSLRDAVLSLSTFEALPPGPSLLSTVFVDAELADLDGPAPEFDRFLATSFEGDPELQAFVPLFIAIHLMPPEACRRAFFLVGDGANGKSVLLNLIIDIIGEEKVAGVSLDALSRNQYAASTLVGKRLNVVSEDESRWIEGERFKALVTGDLIQVERKYAAPFSTRVDCRLVFATNDPPTFKNVNEGLRRRVEIIPFERVFEESEQDRDLPAKLRRELPAILGRAVRAARPFVESGYALPLPASVEAAKGAFIENSSPAVTFFFEHCEVDDAEFRHEAKYVYDAFVEWARGNGHRAMASRTFWKQLRSADRRVWRDMPRSNGVGFMNVKVKDAY